MSNKLRKLNAAPLPNAQGTYVSERLIICIQRRCGGVCSEHGGYGAASGKIEVVQKINHEGEVNRSAESQKVNHEGEEI